MWKCKPKKPFPLGTLSCYITALPPPLCLLLKDLSKNLINVSKKKKNPTTFLSLHVVLIYLFLVCSFNLSVFVTGLKSNNILCIMEVLDTHRSIIVYCKHMLDSYKYSMDT